MAGRCGGCGGGGHGTVPLYCPGTHFSQEGPASPGRWLDAVAALQHRSGVGARQPTSA